MLLAHSKNFENNFIDCFSTFLVNTMSVSVAKQIMSFNPLLQTFIGKHDISHDKCNILVSMIFHSFPRLMLFNVPSIIL